MRSGIHESRFFLSNFHASRSSFSPYHASRINPLPPSKKKKWNICHHMLTSSTQLQNRSFQVVERTRTCTKCQKMKNARAKRAKMMLSNMQICGVFVAVIVVFA